MLFSWTVSEDCGEISIDKEEFALAYANGGIEACTALVQDAIDTYVNNNVVAVAEDSEVQAAVNDLVAELERGT